jgi:hypothetical protein
VREIPTALASDSNAVFVATFVYLLAFPANFAVPKGIDDGVPVTTAAAVLINFVLMALFGVQPADVPRRGLPALQAAGVDAHRRQPW